MRRITHWKHVTFVFPSPLAVKQGDRITGWIEIQRNKFWRRHFESTIEFRVSSSPEVHRRFYEMWR
jgi:hypothetical protein